MPPETLEADGIAAREEAGCPYSFHWALEFPEVFAERGGFDGFVGNPPFLGGMRISPLLGYHYTEFIKRNWNHAKGHADICC